MLRCYGNKAEINCSLLAARRFSANMVALVGSQPRTLTLKDFLQHFLDFRWVCAVMPTSLLGFLKF